VGTDSNIICVPLLWSSIDLCGPLADDAQSAVPASNEIQRRRPRRHGRHTPLSCSWCFVRASLPSDLSQSNDNLCRRGSAKHDDSRLTEDTTPDMNYGTCHIKITAPFHFSQNVVKQRSILTIFLKQIKGQICNKTATEMSTCLGECSLFIS